ncbi:signal transduction histidine kinase [Aquitalea magnusonii]|uniref:histidine kinase n=1 Tax=Aquitalea magnusonii TaxID=332411 RepID=A0A3G9GG97_9NEIS|nr:PAS domain S-box protein [Aquitalea magnusonii]BBF85659.1 signal transduction histidine kinase [Aquitalea magnusonii]
MEKLLADLLQASPIGIAVLDSELRYVHINQQLASSNGLPPAAHIGRTPRDVLPEAGPGLEALMHKVMASRVAECNFEACAEIPPGSGHFTYWTASYHPRFDRQGQPCGIIAMVEDITLKKKAEQAIRASNDRIRKVLDALFTFVSVLSNDGTLQEANRAPLEQAGLELSQVQGKLFWECYWWNHDPAVQAELQQAVAQAARGQTVRYDVVVRMKNDSRMTIDFMLRPLWDEDGQISNLIASGIDITARKQNELALQISETYFREVVESTPDGLMMVDQSGTIRLINTRMEQLFGYSRRELVGEKLDHLLPADFRSQHAHNLSSFFRQPQARGMANRKPLFARHRDGTAFPCEIGLNPMHVGGELLTLACISDVSERYYAKLDLEKALQEKTVLLGEVHHRVKNNLQVISSLLNLQARTATPEVNKALLDSQNHVRSMALIHQLLYERNDFSRIPMSVYIERLSHLLRDVSTGYGNHIVFLFQRDGPEAYLELHNSIPFGLILNEIVVNACKHAFLPGQPGRLEILMHTAEQVQLQIRDNGKGCPDGVTLGNAATLGFQLLPMLTEQLKATLTLETAPGQGCCFTLTIPDLIRE